MSWAEDERTLQNELADLVKHKPPVSRSKVQTVTKIAHDNANHAAQVADIIDKFVGKAPTQYRLSGLYLIDSICKKKDGPSVQCRTHFAQRMESILKNALEASEKDRESIKRVVSLWGKGDVFSQEQLGRWAFMIKEKTGSAPDGIAPIAPQSELVNSLQQQLAAASQQQSLLAALAGPAAGLNLASLLPNLQAVNLAALFGGQAAPASVAAPAPAAPASSGFFDYEDDEDDENDEVRIMKQRQRIEQEQQRRRDEEDRQRREREERARLAAAHHQQLQNIANQPNVEQPMNPYESPAGAQHQHSVAPLRPGNVPPPHGGHGYPNQQQGPPSHQGYHHQGPPQHFQQPQHQPQQHQQQSQQVLSVVEDVYDDPNVPAGHKKVLTQTLFVGNLSPSVTDLMLYAAFSQYGSVIAMKYHMDKHFAFMSFGSRKESENAKQALHFVPLDGREMKVGWANPYAESYEFDRDGGFSIVPLNAVPRFTPNPVSSRFIDKMRKDLLREPTLLHRVLGAKQAGAEDGAGRPKRKFENGDESFSKRPKYSDDPFEVVPQAYDGNNNSAGNQRPRGSGYDRHDSYRDNRSSYNNYGSSGGDDFSVPMSGSGR